MKEQKQTKNDLLPGWPPFVEFKQSMVDLLDEAQKPIKEKLNTVEACLIGHINKTDANFKKMDTRLTGHINKTEANFKAVEINFKAVKTYLSNHVTDTNRKIDNLSTKVDQLLEKFN